MAELLRERRRSEVPQLEQEAPALEVREQPPQQSLNREEAPSRNERRNRQIHVPVPESRPPRDSMLGALEEALSQDLAEVFRALPADRQVAFKEKGEELARDIQNMIGQNKWQGHKVLKRLTDWLNMIPNVNVYYLRQMAKIKFDALADIYESRPQGL